MKSKRTAIIAVLATVACAAAFAVAQSSNVAPVSSAFAGTWEGRLNDRPWVDLKINEAGRKISGTVVFYVHERSDVASPWRVTAESPVPLLAPRVDGKTLTFEVPPPRCYDCAELAPNVKFRITLAGPNEARLWRLDDPEPGKDPGPGFKLIRRGGKAAFESPSQRRAPLVSVEFRLAVDWGRTPALFRAFLFTLP